MAIKDTEQPIQDLNWLAYQEALRSGIFREMTPGDFVAFFDGQLIASGPRDEVLKQIQGKGAMLHQINHPDQTVEIPSVLRISRPRILPKTHR